MTLPTGILLPQEILTSTGYTAFTLFVAFNTIIYLGLTVAKFTPWPRQLSASRVRDLLPDTVERDVTVRTLAPEQRDLVSEPFMAQRMDTAQRTIPIGLSLTGALVAGVALLNMLLSPATLEGEYLVQLITGVVIVVIAQIMTRRQMSAHRLTWLWAGLVTLCVVETVVGAWRWDTPISLTYAVLLTAAIPPVTMAWRPALVGGGISLAVTSMGGILLDPVTSPQWIVASVSAFLVGAGLLYLRISGTDALTLEQMRANTIASTDLVTGLLSRAGLLSLAATVAGTAERANEPVCVMLVDIDGMSRINAQYGMAYGDEVLQFVGRAIVACLREGDLVSRWVGDRFLALGLGGAPDPEQLAARIDEAINVTGIALGKSPVTVHVGTASGAPSQSKLEELEAAAELSLLRA